MDWQTFSSSWGFNYATLLGFLVTAGLALWTYLSLPRSRMAYDIQHSIIIGRNQTAFSGDLEVTYRGAPISRATLTRLYVWNDGNQTIRREDVTPKFPLGVSVPGGEFFLRAQISQLAHDAMDVSLGDGDEGSETLTFEYIEPRQGFVCEVLHTGAPTDFSFEGVLIRAGEPVQRELPPSKTSLPLAFMVSFCGIALVSVLAYLHGSIFKANDSLPSYLFGTGLMIAAACSCLFTCFRIVRGSIRSANFGKPQADTNP